MPKPKPANEPKKRSQEELLLERIASFRHDPYGYVMFAFPWGVKGGPLEKRSGPRMWQVKILKRIGERLRQTAGMRRWEVIREAIVSGHGVGKTALFVMIICWGASTFPFTRGLVTANTEEQLRGKTWPELQKWHSMSINKHWFEVTATAMFHVNPEYAKRWRFDAVTWSENNTEAFAGLHNEGKRIVLAFDEASGIPPVIWEVSEGATTDEETEILWLVAGNPTRPIGRFKDCFNRLRHRWGTTHVDASKVEGTNKTLHAQWARDYGETSDFYKVRVLGQFPSASPNQLIPEEWVRRARRPFIGDGSIPVNLVSADVADGGVDLSVITNAKEYLSHTHVTRQRQYNFASSESPIKVAQAVLRDWEYTRTSRNGRDRVIIDSMGVGAGTAGYCMQAQVPTVAYKGGAASSSPQMWRNQRVQCYINLRNALRDSTLTFDPQCWESEADFDEFVEQICSVMRAPANDKVEDLQTKEQMLREGTKSPDRADSVAMLLTGMVPQYRPKDGTAEPTTVKVVHSTALAGLDV